jgi:hypothetical protein
MLWLELKVFGELLQIKRIRKHAGLVTSVPNNVGGPVSEELTVDSYVQLHHCASLQYVPDGAKCWVELKRLSYS